MKEQRNLTAGVALLALGVFLLLRRTIVFSGAGPILLLLGAIFFVLSALRSFRGPLYPAGILLGLGTGFLLREPLEPWFPHWATLLLGLACGFLLVAAIDTTAEHRRRPAPLAPGLILLGIALFAGLARRVDMEGLFAGLSNLWPWILIAAGVALVVTALTRRRT